LREKAREQLILIGETTGKAVFALLSLSSMT